MDERWFKEKETSLVDFAFKIYKDYFNEKYKDSLKIKLENLLLEL